MTPKQIQISADALQHAREQIVYWKEIEALHSDKFKDAGLGRYPGTLVDVEVSKVHVGRVNVTKLLRKLNIAQHVFNKFYTINTTQIRAKLVNKRISVRETV